MTPRGNKPNERERATIEAKVRLYWLERTVVVTPYARGRMNRPGRSVLDVDLDSVILGGELSRIQPGPPDRYLMVGKKVDPPRTLRVVVEFSEAEGEIVVITTY